MATEEKMICLILVAVEKHSEDKKGTFEEMEVEVVKYVTDMRRNGFPITEESIQIKET
jgi:hypothetical protein